MSNQDRWIQRLKNLRAAFDRLQDACRKEEYSELETAGLIQTYQVAFELAWKTMKDKLLFDGYQVDSPRGTIRKAFEVNLIQSAEEWLEALETRNLLSHTYDEELAEGAIALIRGRLEPMLQQCVEKLVGLANDD